MAIVVDERPRRSWTPRGVVVMAVKKSELYSSLWKLCDELRGGMDASQYKDYVLVLLFMKYVSDKAATRRDYLLDVPEGARFADMVAAKNQKDIGDRINKIIARLALANPSLRGAIDVANFNDPDKLGKGQEMVDRLTKLIGIFQNPALDFGANTAEGDDLLGDAYEYLMRNFATEAGKSKGQFYTPAEVSRIMAEVVGASRATSNQQSIYDPTCGSGSLLLKAHAAAKSATGFDLAIYGQEMDNATAALARMNMVLHDAETAEIHQDNTLAAPFWTEGPRELKRFDFVVANPPFSTKSWTIGFDPEHDDFGRFPYGQPPKRNGDYAFLLHVLSSLKSTGKAAVIVPHGVLFRGNAEGVIRREFVRRGYIKGIIGLPPNLFYGTGIPACIVVFDKEGADERDGIFMLDASRGFRKDGPKNRLREQDIHRILDVFTRQRATGSYSRLVSNDEISQNGFNLNLARYVDSSDPEDLHDIDGHVSGGIPRRDVEGLSALWAVAPRLKAELFDSTGHDGYANLRVAPTEIDEVVLSDSEVRAWSDRVRESHAHWRAGFLGAMRAIDIGSGPRPVFSAEAENLLTAFEGVPLVDPYDVYQRLMDFWAATLQDDLYLIVDVGRVDGAAPHVTTDPNDVDGATFTVGKIKYRSDLIPASVVAASFFPEDVAAIDALVSDVGRVEGEVNAQVEAEAVEGGLLEEAVDDKGKPSRRLIAVRLRDVEGDGDSAEERAALLALEASLDELAAAKARLKAARTQLDAEIAKKFASLDLDQINALLVDGKWTARLSDDLETELRRVLLAFTSRIRVLASRYDRPLPELVRDATAKADRTVAALRAMGITWP